MNHTKQNITASVSPEAAAFFHRRIKNTFTEYLGLEVVHYEDGYCKTRLKIKPEFLNPIGGLHGGLLFTIADTTAGAAAVHLDSESTITTVNGDIQYMRPALDLDYLYAEATLIKDGKRMAFVDVHLLTEDNTLLAKSAFTFARFVLPTEDSSEESY